MDKVSDLEKQLQTEKVNKAAQIEALQTTITQLETNYCDSLRNERLAADRLRSLQKQLEE